MKEKIKTVRPILRRALRAAAFWAAGMSAAMLALSIYGCWKGNAEYQKAEKQYAVPQAPQACPAEKEENSFAARQIDFDALQAQNPEVVGWIDFDALPISYPITHTDNNDYYLTHLWNGQSNREGSIFMEASNTGWDALSVILYGHNMKNGDMFGQLKKYGDASFYAEKGGWFTLYTPHNGNWRYQIFGVETVDATKNVYTVGFSVGRSYTTYLKKLCADRLYKTGVTVYAQDHILVLSTCMGSDSKRLIVCARRAMAC